MPYINLSLDRKITRLRLDVIDMGQRLAEGLRMDDTVSYYMIGNYNHNRKVLFWWGGKRYGSFSRAMQFPTRKDALAYIKENDLRYLNVYPADAIKAQLVEDSITEIAHAAANYKKRRMCPVCGKHAAISKDARGVRDGIKHKDYPCRLCAINDEELRVEDFVRMRSAMAQFDEIEETPRFTKEDFEVISREAARRRIFPTEPPNVKNACINVG